MNASTGLDLERPPRFGPARVAMSIVGVLLVAAGWGQVGAANAQLDEERLEVDGVPLTLLAPADLRVAAPGVVATHGFGGSGTLMRPFALRLVEAGYVVALPDLPGHGGNRAPLSGPEAGRADTVSGAPGRGQVVHAVAVGLDVLTDREDVDAGQLVLLGHSMGSSAVLTAAVAAPERVVAVVAVSPTDAQVTPDVPPNVLLLAGELEPRFVLNAESLLERAGGASSGPAGGTARRLEIVPFVEHVSVLFSPTAHELAVDWFDASLQRTAAAEPSVPRTIVWWFVALVGTVTVWRAALPVLVDSEVTAVRRGRPVLGLVVGAVGATLVSGAIGSSLDLDALGGMALGPNLAVWFLLAGLGWARIGPRPGPPRGRDLVWAGVLLLVLIVAFGLLATRVWLPWFPGAHRVVYIPLLAAALLPWSVTGAAALQARRGWRGVGWWVTVSFVLLVTLGAAAGVVPGLGPLVLLLPLLPLLLGLTMLVSAPVQRPWAAGIATASFLAWSMAAIFPLV